MTEKRLFLDAYRQGATEAVALTYRGDHDEFLKKMNVVYPAGQTFGETVQLIDEIYSRPENGGIGLNSAVLACVIKAEGLPEQYWYALLATARSDAKAMRQTETR